MIMNSHSPILCLAFYIFDEAKVASRKFGKLFLNGRCHRKDIYDNLAANGSNKIMKEPPCNVT